MNFKDKEELEKKLQDCELDWIKMREIAEKMQAENKKLREALEFYSEPWERGELDDELLVRKIGSYDNFREVHSIAKEALKEVEDTK